MKTWIRTQDDCLVNLNYITVVKPYGPNSASIVGWSTNSSHDGMITFGVYNTEQAAALVLYQFQSWLADGEGDIFVFPSHQIGKRKIGEI